MHLSQASKTVRKKTEHLTHPYKHTRTLHLPSFVHIYTKKHTIRTNGLTHTYKYIQKNTHTHTKTHNYISTLGVWQRRGKNQSGRPGTWMNRLWSKPHQRHIDDLPQTSIFLPSVGSGLLIASGVLVTSATLACSGSQNQLVTIKCWLDLLSRLVTQ